MAEKDLVKTVKENVASIADEAKHRANATVDHMKEEANKAAAEQVKAERELRNSRAGH